MRTLPGGAETQECPLCNISIPVHDRFSAKGSPQLNSKPPRGAHQGVRVWGRITPRPRPDRKCAQPSGGCQSMLSVIARMCPRCRSTCYKSGTASATMSRPPASTALRDACLPLRYRQWYPGRDPSLIDWYGSEDAEEAGEGGHKCATSSCDNGNFAAPPNMLCNGTTGVRPCLSHHRSPLSASTPYSWKVEQDGSHHPPSSLRIDPPNRCSRCLCSGWSETPTPHDTATTRSRIRPVLLTRRSWRMCSTKLGSGIRNRRCGCTAAGWRRNRRLFVLMCGPVPAFLHPAQSLCCGPWSISFGKAMPRRSNRGVEFLGRTALNRRELTASAVRRGPLSPGAILPDHPVHVPIPRIAGRDLTWWPTTSLLERQRAPSIPADLFALADHDGVVVVPSAAKRRSAWPGKGQRGESASQALAEGMTVTQASKKLAFCE